MSEESKPVPSAYNVWCQIKKKKKKEHIFGSVIVWAVMSLQSLGQVIALHGYITAREWGHLMHPAVHTLLPLGVTMLQAGDGSIHTAKQIQGCFHEHQDEVKLHSWQSSIHILLGVSFILSTPCISGRINKIHFQIHVAFAWASVGQVPRRWIIPSPEWKITGSKSVVSLRTSSLRPRKLRNWMPSIPLLFQLASKKASFFSPRLYM